MTRRQAALLATVTVGLTSAVAAGCRPATPHSRPQVLPFGPGLEWVTGSPPDSVDRSALRNVDRDTVVAVTPAAEPRAIAELDRRPVMRLSADEVREYAGRAAIPPDGTTRAYLVRGLAIEGRFDSYEQMMCGGGVLIVRCGFSKDKPLRKRPLILLREDDIDRVYLDVPIPI